MLRRLEVSRSSAAAAESAPVEPHTSKAKRGARGKATSDCQLPTAQGTVTGLALQLQDTAESGPELHQYAWAEGMLLQAELEHGSGHDAGARAVCACFADDLGTLHDCVSVRRRYSG